MNQKTKPAPVKPEDETEELPMAAKTEQQGAYTVPKFDRTKLRPRQTMKHAGKLGLDSATNEILEKNKLHARWINEDDMGRAQEATDYLGYQPLMKDGSRVVRQVGGGMTACLMVTPEDFYAESQAAKQEAVLDPVKTQKGQRINPTTGKKEIIDLGIGDGEYVPDGKEQAVQEDKSASLLR